VTARELAEGALHQLDASETTAYVIGAAVLDLADAVRGLSGKSIRVDKGVPLGEFVAKVGHREPMSHERADRADQAVGNLARMRSRIRFVLDHPTEESIVDRIRAIVDGPES